MGSGERSRSLSLALVILALGGAIVGCGSSAQTGNASTSNGQEKKLPLATSTTRAGGVAIALTATPARAKIDFPVRFEVTASARRAAGALGYELRYGDGTTAENVVPMFCLAGKGAKGAPVRETWHLVHRYKAPGLYRVSVRVYVNCTSDRATATVTVSIA